MPPAHSIAESAIEGHPVRVLTSATAKVSAAFAPGVGMVGCSLTHRAEQLLGLRNGLDRYAQTGSTMGIPLLHPWANRLSGLDYAIGGPRGKLDSHVPPLRPPPQRPR